MPELPLPPMIGGGGIALAFLFVAFGLPLLAPLAVIVPFVAAFVLAGWPGVGALFGVMILLGFSVTGYHDEDTPYVV